MLQHEQVVHFPSKLAFKLIDKVLELVLMAPWHIVRLQDPRVSLHLKQCFVG